MSAEPHHVRLSRQAERRPASSRWRGTGRTARATQPRTRERGRRRARHAGLRSPLLPGPPDPRRALPRPGRFQTRALRRPSPGAALQGPTTPDFSGAVGSDPALPYFVVLVVSVGSASGLRVGLDRQVPAFQREDVTLSAPAYWTATVWPPFRAPWSRHRLANGAGVGEARGRGGEVDFPRSPGRRPGSGSGRRGRPSVSAAVQVDVAGERDHRRARCRASRTR